MSGYENGLGGRLAALALMVGVPLGVVAVQLALDESSMPAAEPLVQPASRPATIPAVPNLDTIE